MTQQTPKPWLAMCLALAIASCGPSRPAPQQINPLAVAEEYAAKHYPQAVPRGLERAWHVEDHGEIWTVEMFAQGHVGGGIRMAINKQTGKVLGAEQTQ